MIIVLDFGAQYARLIVRRVRELRVYCELLPASTPWNDIVARAPDGVILSGGPASVLDEGSPRCAPELFTSGIPILGICYGLQLMAIELGGDVEPSTHREYGSAQLEISDHGSIFDTLPSEMTVWMSHGDRVTKLPTGFAGIAHTANSEYAAVADGRSHIGIQFHPEVSHTPRGQDILRNFVLGVCKAQPTWTPANFAADAIEHVKDQVQGGRVLCALSGGVDSMVAATLISHAIGDRLTCVFVDTGLLRLNEARDLLTVFRESLPARVIHIDAAERFLKTLEGIVDPEEKRIRIGHEFVGIFTEEALKLGTIEFLAQGTLYPDVIESTSHDTHGSAKIKTHHNVGGLPDDLGFKLVEPLRYLFKDEVREMGLELGLPEKLVGRQPFPGPGLAVRIIGEVTRERLQVLRQADDIIHQEVRAAGWYDKLWQSFAVLTPMQTVGVMGDGRTYGNVVAIRAVVSQDAMTADWARLPHDLLAAISSRMVNEVPEVTRVVYDITSKPPATIEWE